MGIWLFTGGPIAEIAALAMAGVAFDAPPPAPEAQTALALPAPLAEPLPGQVSGRMFVDLTPGAAATGGEIRRAPDGLFYVDARVNGVPVRFLVDTGASTIVLTHADAARAGVLSQPVAFDESADTAGGRTAMARVKLAHLAAGPAERRNVDAAIASEGLGVSLLGQSWLAQLESVTIRGDRMVLQ